MRNEQQYQLVGCRLGIHAGLIGWLDRVDEPQRDVTTDRFIDGPQSGIDTRS
jgi:hypothetical protein